MKAVYADTSALVKLVVEEPETAGLQSWLAESDHVFVAGDLVRTELMRAVRRVVPDRVRAAREVLDGLAMLQVRSSVFEEAGRLDPIGLRSLDAIHLASAFSLGDDLEALLTYDERLAVAAESHGIAVVAPG
ncbi:MAG: type II toxin-antitoxin system VapC family toxin [Actinomycetota bacterium]